MKFFLTIASGAALASASQSGITIEKNDSFLAFGEESDVVLSRTGDGAANLVATLTIEGDVSVTGETSFESNSDGTQTLSDLFDQVQSLDSDASDAASTLSDVSDEVDDLSTSLSSVVDDVAALASDLSDTTDSVDALSDSLDTATSDVSGLSDDLDALSTSLSATQAELSAVNTTVKGLSADVRSLKSDVTALKSALSTSPGRIDQAMKEAYCSRINCCNEESDWLDSDTLLCWSNEYDDYESDPCGCRVEFVEASKTWKWHERYCVDALGGQLFSVHTSTAAAAIAAYDTSSYSVYIGLHDYQSEDQWKNTDGTPANWLGWNSGEPNDSNGEDCAEIYPSTTGLNDIDCATVYSSRYASACTIFDPLEKKASTSMDKVLQEARCSRVNCCNEDSAWLDDDTLLCWSNSYEFFNEDPCGCTIEFTEFAGSWSEHEKYCMDNFGGQLTSLHSGNAAAAIAAFDTSSYSVFVGLHDYHSEDDWSNTDGTPANWLGWNSGEPNDSNGEDCAEVYPSTDGLNDIDCDAAYSNRYASACTVMNPTRNLRDVTADQAEKEARCSRINCCNEASAWLDGDTLQCWSSSYDSFAADPCSCTVEFVEKSASWSYHEKYCQEGLGGQLFSIHTGTAAGLIADFSTSSASIFIGLHDYYTEDDWTYTDGTPYDWDGWNSGEPNDSNGEDCAEVYPSTEKMNDIDCDTTYSNRYASACLLLS